MFSINLAYFPLLISPQSLVHLLYPHFIITPVSPISSVSHSSPISSVSRSSLIYPSYHHPVSPISPVSRSSFISPYYHHLVSHISSISRRSHISSFSRISLISTSFQHPIISYILSLSYLSYLLSLSYLCYLPILPLPQSLLSPQYLIPLLSPQSLVSLLSPHLTIIPVSRISLISPSYHHLSRECTRMLQSALLKAVVICSPYFSTVKMAIGISVVVYTVVLKRHLTSRAVFVIIGLYNILRIDVCWLLPYSFQQISEIRVSLIRIQVGNESNYAPIPRHIKLITL